MRIIKYFFAVIAICALGLVFFEVPRIYSIPTLLILTLIYFAVINAFEKKIKVSLESFRIAYGKVSRASFRLTDTSRKLKTKNESVYQVFHESMGTIGSISATAKENLVLVEKNQKQNEVSRIVASEGQETLNTVINEIKQLAAYSNKIKEVTSLIDDISLKTNILSLNAAVEAARAGEQGRGFSVVAEAVRDLASQSMAATKTINSVIESVVERAEIGAKYADQSGEKIKQILSHIESSAEMSRKVQSDSESQNDQIMLASEAMQSIQTQASENTELSSQSMTVATDLSLQSASLEALISDLSEIFQVDSASEKIKKPLIFARELAQKISVRIDQALSRENLSLASVLEFNYTEISGLHVTSLASLFDISKVPASGFVPKKYHTNYDHLFDNEIQLACDEVFKLGTEYLFALPVDLNAYAPIHNKKFCKAWTGLSDQDLIGNRVKRFFYDNLTFLKSVRVGLAPVNISLPQVLSNRKILESSGCYLRNTKTNRSAFMVQTYLRDTGEIATNLSVPIFIRGQRFGSIVVCWLENE